MAADIGLQATRLRRLRIALNASTIFFHILVILLCGICIAKYPEDEYGDPGNSYLYIFMLGCPAAGMIIWCSIDILLHFVARRQGVPHRGAAITLVFLFVAVVVISIITCVALRAETNGERDGGPNLTRYSLGDEYFWAAWAMVWAALLSHLALMVVAFRQLALVSRVGIKSIELSKRDDGPASA